jgi:hypothetical protein
LRYSCGHVSTKKIVRGLKDAAASTPPPLRSSRYIRYRDNIGDNQYGESYNIGSKQYSLKNLSYCRIHRFLESVTLLTREALLSDGHHFSYQKVHPQRTVILNHYSLVIAGLRVPSSRRHPPCGELQGPVTATDRSRGDAGLPAHHSTGHLETFERVTAWTSAGTERDALGPCASLG